MASRGNSSSTMSVIIVVIWKAAGVVVDVTVLMVTVMSHDKMD